MRLLAGILQIIGLALLFTPLLGIGIVAILIGAPLFFLGDKVDEKSTKKMLNEMADNSKKKLETFESSFEKNPFSAETEKAYNNLPKFSRPNLGNYTLSDAERTDVLTGRAAALPISTVIAETLGLRPPKVNNLAEDNLAAKSVIKKICKKLIDFPEDGEWIRSSQTVISVNGDQNASWYLNGKPLKSYNRQLELKRAGVHKLTAVLEDCSETSEVFLELAQN